MSLKASKDWLHKEYPKTCAETDFWRQVKRTVQGEPVGEDQIEQIVGAVQSHLQLSVDDWLLDLCCGNGALSSRVFDLCSGGLGVDFSEYLIQIARKYFANDRAQYLVQDVVEFCATTTDCRRFTKASCYGAFCYLAPAQAHQILSNLRTRFDNLERLFLGNLADRSKAELFYRDGLDTPAVLDDPSTPLGYWWDVETFVELADTCGWAAEIDRMPAEFYGSHYRFDVTLLPAPRHPG